MPLNSAVLAFNNFTSCKSTMTVTDDTSAEALSSKVLVVNIPRAHAWRGQDFFLYVNFSYSFVTVQVVTAESPKLL